MKNGIARLTIIITFAFFGQILPSESSDDFEDELLESLRPRSSYLPAYWAQKIKTPAKIEIEDIDDEIEQELITHDSDDDYSEYIKGKEKIYLQNMYEETLICKIDDQTQQNIGQGGRVLIGSLWQKIPKTSIRRNKYTSFFSDITPLLYAEMLTVNPMTLTAYLVSLKTFIKRRKNLIVYIEPSALNQPWHIRSEWEPIPHDETNEDIEENWQEIDEALKEIDDIEENWQENK